MCVDLSISEIPISRARRKTVAITLCIAAIANASVPAVFFSDANLLGGSNPHDRVLIALIVMAVYAIGLLLLLFNADVGYASGYVVATSVIATLASAMVVFTSVEPALWDWNELYAVILVLAGFTFAVCSNIVFLIASIKYARAINPRLHMGGFFLGMASSLALLIVYSSILG